MSIPASRLSLPAAFFTNSFMAFAALSPASSSVPADWIVITRPRQDRNGVGSIAAAMLPTPFLSCRGRVMTIQSAGTLDEAGDKAAKAMKEFVKKAAGKDNLEAGMLMSLLSDMAVCQVVDPLRTVRVEFPLDVLETYGYRLP